MHKIRLQYLAEVYDETFVSPASASGQLYLAYAALDQAIIGHAIETKPGEIDVSTLTAVQRATAVECLRVIAERARTVMLRLVIYDAANEYILSTPLDQLDTSESGEAIHKNLQGDPGSSPGCEICVRWLLVRRASPGSVYATQ